MGMARTALIIGGGLMGVTSAWYLVQRGFQVTVLERREGPGLETSFANGGLITPSQSDPWNAPGTLGLLLKYLGREDSPLLLRPRALPGMLRWGLKFLRASRPLPWRRATEANLRLGLYSANALRDLRRELSLQYDARAAGTLKVFREPQALDGSVSLAESLAPLGLRYRRMSPAQAVELEPLLRPLQAELCGAIHYPDDESGDAHAFTRQMEERARHAGVQFEFGTEVFRLRRNGDVVAAAVTDRGEYAADSYLLCAASASPGLVAPLGLRLPIYPVKGYSATIAATAWTRPLGLPLVDFSRKFVITPLGRRLRIAGTAEFTGFDTRPNPQRSASLVSQALGLVPELAAQADPSRIEHWAGLRPMTCDGSPVVGETPYRNLFLNAGHGPLGWTLAAGSGLLVAQRMAGEAPGISLAGLDYARFAS